MVHIRRRPSKLDEEVRIPQCIKCDIGKRDPGADLVRGVPLGDGEGTVAREGGNVHGVALEVGRAAVLALLQTRAAYDWVRKDSTEESGEGDGFCYGEEHLVCGEEVETRE